MPHPYYGRELKRKSKRSRAPWFVAILILAIILALPWFMPESSSKSGFFKYIKAVTTFPMSYEWTHSYRYAPPPPPELELPSETDESKPDDSFFPLAIGNKWTYEHKKTGGIMDPEEQISTKIIEIVGEEKIEEFRLLKAIATENKQTDVYYYWDNEGLHVTPDNKRPWRHSILVLKSNPSEGDTWNEGDAQSTVTGKEELQTSSGLYQCIVVETRISKGEDQVYTTWYAEGVGIVRQHFGSKARGEDVWTLTNFVAR